MASAFENRLMSLDEWPERKLLLELTGFAEYHMSIANQVVDVIVGRLQNVLLYLYFYDLYTYIRYFSLAQK